MCIRDRARTCGSSARRRQLVAGSATGAGAEYRTGVDASPGFQSTGGGPIGRSTAAGRSALPPILLPPARDAPSRAPARLGSPAILRLRTNGAIAQLEERLNGM